MWPGIVLLQNQITLLHKRDCNRTQDLIPIPFCGHIARNNNQLWFYPVSNASPDHNGATPKPIPFDNTSVGKAFSATSVHTTSTICAIESEPRLVRKKNSSPLPQSEIAWAHSTQPRHTTQPTCLGQRQTNVWTTSSKTDLTQSTSNSLRRNLSIMRTYCIKGSFGSSEMTIPQMCQTDCPVATSRRHAWTPRPRSVC